ncbi:uncharacterized protein K460DRAFT_355260 [Cucurbitaria berberidis CBS 394.84]|uniref:Uncharacterized protein n=1 Tax=Cucurbitaria berberidis CBS 394.84 TaxID=1168544 RepID=A0A9P4GHR1_9PLEO|nr:uncharacterized protein K460DRAFT_355260 [Cucurbitaria berberidis CBS 394.84]KAF1845439.1 hypothetical protein K460DRAFT_355260 [Cucurbitaria berberidis CBS 394.84]
MAPPGFGPPGYSIPQRYRHREAPPQGADTNTRPYLIFFSYLGTCVSVTVFIILKILKRYSVLQKSTTAQPPPRKHVWLFTALAVGSLATTWSFMVQYFSISYQTWLMWRSYLELDPHHRHWGLWLRETSLFKEAWETLIVGTARYWWSHQIFFFALGLGLYLEQKGIRRGIKYTWAFMLLGQIVAISFATNLFFLTLLLSPPAPPPPSSGVYRRKWLGPWLLNLVAILATTYPALLLADEHYWHHPTAFMPVLLAPHVALLVLPFARAILPAKYFNDNDVDFTDKVYNYMWALVLGNAGLMLLRATASSYAYSGFRGIRDALLEHPVVSTVGFDVIFCWITWICWYQTQSTTTNTNVKERFVGTDGGLVGDASNTAVGASGYDGGVRRR